MNECVNLFDEAVAIPEKGERLARPGLSKLSLAEFEERCAKACDDSVEEFRDWLKAHHMAIVPCNACLPFCRGWHIADRKELEEIAADRKRAAG